MVAELKKQGLVDKLTITDAQGNANTQIQQIQSMIDADVDAIMVDRRLVDRARPRHRRCLRQGHRSHQLRQPGQHRQADRQDQHQLQAKWGKLAAEWLVEQLGGKGKIIVLNGPAGVSVSDDRRKGAQPVLDANPDIEILAETNTAYNAAPAQEAMTSLLFSNPEIDGMLELGGALSAGAVLAVGQPGSRPACRSPARTTGQFLELWKEKELTAWATMQPNWLGGLAVYAAVKALQGEDIPPSSRCRCRSSTTTTSTAIWPVLRTSRPTATSTRPTSTALFDELIVKSLKKSSR